MSNFQDDNVIDLYPAENPPATTTPMYSRLPYPTYRPEPLYQPDIPPPSPPPKKQKNIFRNFALTIIAVAIGGCFLGIGLGAGYIAMQHWMPEPVEIEVQQQTSFNSVALEPMIISIDPHIPDFTEVISDVKDAVVSINVTTTTSRGFLPAAEQTGAGSGFIFAQDDENVFIATNHHVIAYANIVTISLDDNEKVNAQVIGVDPEIDLAVLVVSIAALEEKGVPFTVASFGCSDNMRIGDSVVAIGNAMGAGQTATKGIISAVNIEITIQDPNTRSVVTLDVLQTDAAVNQGNSGGPLINQHGEVVGIVTAKLFGHGVEGMGYVLPINDVRELLESMRELAPAHQVWIGITTEEVTEQIRDMFNLPSVGRLVREVVPDSPAYFAGIMERDIIVSFGEHPTLNFDDFRAAIATASPGDEVIFGIYRDGMYIEIPVVLGRVLW